MQIAYEYIAMSLSVLNPCSFFDEGARKASKAGGMPTLYGQIFCPRPSTTYH
jgi:hypothetical protein